MREKVLIIVCLFAFFGFVGIFIIPSFTKDESLSCEEKERQIRNQISQANYCKTNSDCEITEKTAGVVCNCFDLIYKDQNLDMIVENIRKFQNECKEYLEQISCETCEARPDSAHVVCGFQNKCFIKSN